MSIARRGSSTSRPSPDRHPIVLVLGVDVDREALVRAEAGAGRDEATHDDVLLEAAEVVDACR